MDLPGAQGPSRSGNPRRPESAEGADMAKGGWAGCAASWDGTPLTCRPRQGLQERPGFNLLGEPQAGAPASHTAGPNLPRQGCRERAHSVCTRLTWEPTRRFRPRASLLSCSVSGERRTPERGGRWERGQLERFSGAPAPPEVRASCSSSRLPVARSRLALHPSSPALSWGRLQATPRTPAH